MRRGGRRSKIKYRSAKRKPDSGPRFLFTNEITEWFDRVLDARRAALARAVESIKT